MVNLTDLRNYFQNRWIDKTHQLTSKLKKGEWYDFDQRVLHCLFDELVSFVEDEVGIKMLEGWTKLTGAAYQLEKDDPKYDEPIQQAIDARAILELYKWWKEIRPVRSDPYDETGPDGEISSLKIIDKLKQQEDEDTEMLCRLIKIRGAMWT